MPLLDDLKATSQVLKAEALEAQQRSDQLQATYQRHINPKMRQIFRYLSELVKEVSYIKPDTLVDFELPIFGKMQGLRQGEYRLTVDSLENMQKILLRCRCTGGQTARFKVSPTSVAADLRDQFVNHGLAFDSWDFQDEYQNLVGQRFEVRGEIPLRVRVEADIEHSLIQLHVTNFGAPISRQAQYRPEQITEEFLDDLGNFILRRHNRLIQLPISSEERAELRQRMEQETEQRSGGRMGNPFRRKKS